MQMVSLIWGILAIVGLLIGFIPCLGSLNWLNIPFAIIGLVIGVVALSKSTPQTKGGALAGTIMCGIATVLGFLRLMIGGGIF